MTIRQLIDNFRNRMGVLLSNDEVEKLRILRDRSVQISHEMNDEVHRLRSIVEELQLTIANRLNESDRLIAEANQRTEAVEKELTELKGRIVNRLKRWRRSVNISPVMKSNMDKFILSIQLDLKDSGEVGE